eukprot:1378587-Amphidinium_carterae.1
MVSGLRQKRLSHLCICPVAACHCKVTRKPRRQVSPHDGPAHSSTIQLLLKPLHILELSLKHRQLAKTLKWTPRKGHMQNCNNSAMSVQDLESSATKAFSRNACCRAQEHA